MVEVTDEIRRVTRRLLDEVERGHIDDSSIDAPDDEEIAALRRQDRVRERRRAASAASRGARRAADPVTKKHAS
jgi:hypothetical protein